MNVVEFPPKVTFSIAQVAEVFDVDPRTVRRWADINNQTPERPALPRRSDGNFDIPTLIFWAVLTRTPVPAIGGSDD